MNYSSVERFFSYAQERYRILLRRREGLGKPWTQMNTLQSYRFCNVFREDDRVTIWFRENVRLPFGRMDDIVWACVLFRFVNRIETGKELLDAGLFVQNNWNATKFRKTMSKCKPMLGAAYMIKTPNGKDKIAGLTEIFTNMLDDMAFPNNVFCCATLEEAVDCLSQYPFVGRFMAYEIACDLMFSPRFSFIDRYTWANPGPGAKRGLSRLTNSTSHLTDNFAKLSEGEMLQMMCELLQRAGNVHYWQGHWPRWDMRTVEHTLCEWDKFMRAELGEGKPKQKFEGR